MLPGSPLGCREVGWVMSNGRNAVAVARRVGPNAYEVGATGSEWVARLYLAQPVRHGTGGIWVVTRTASPAGSY